MRVSILGDSFVKSFKHTWIERIANDLGWQIILQKGNAGGCEHFIYSDFKDMLLTHEIDLALFAHTEPHRLANPHRYGINVVVADMEDSNLPPQVRSAAQQYYANLYHDRFHKDTHDLMVADIQRICHDRGIKQIHLQCFNNYVPMQHGLWITNGLHDLATLNGQDYYKDASLKNHFNEQLHEKFASWLSNHIRYYLANDMDLHTVILYKEEFQ